MSVSKLILFLCLITVSARLRPKPAEPVIIEIIGNREAENKFDQLRDIKGYGEELAVKQWKNRAVVFFNTTDVTGLMEMIKREYPKQQIILFKNPFYNFNRKYCNGKGWVKEWDNIILSANLVADPKMQREYLQRVD